MSLIIKSGSTTDLANVDSDKQLLVNLPKDPTKSGTVRILDSDGNPIDTTENSYVRVSGATLALYDQIEGNAINTNLWNPSDASVMTIAQANGFITLNSASITTANAYGNLKTVKVLPLYGSLPLLPELTVKTANLPQAGVTAEIGLIMASAGSAPTDGCFFRFDPAGGFYAVLNNGGTETRSGNLAGTTATDTTGSSITLPPSNLNCHLYAFEVVEDHVLFTIDDVQVADVQVPAGQAFPFNNGRQTCGMRMFWTTAPATAPQVSIGQVTIKYEDLQQSRSWGEVLASMGRGGCQSPVTPFGQTSNHTNSTSPVSATLSNTAAGYATLGGRYQFAAVSGAATDYALFAFQIPSGFQMFLNSISISTANTGAIGSAITPTLLEWALGINSSAVSLATADGAGTWAPRRIPLGMQAFGLSAFIGAQPSDITRRFDTPLVVDSGRFLHIILQIPSGVNTASQIFRGTVMLNCFFE